MAPGNPRVLLTPPKWLHALNHQCPASSDPLLPKMENHLCARPELLTGPGKQGLDLSFLEEKRLLAASLGSPGSSP